jgi:uncharacterized protein YjbI with pentapeptide repeats
MPMAADSGKSTALRGLRVREPGAVEIDLRVPGKVGRNSAGLGPSARKDAELKTWTLAYGHVRGPGWRMAEQTEVEWEPRCERAGCIGICLPSARMCLAHASEDEIAAALERIAETGEIDARGVPITSALLEWILAAARRWENTEEQVKVARFDRATFSDDAQFRDVTFKSDASFGLATFEGRAGFSHATFGGGAKFEGATFNGDAEFNVTTFKGPADFGKANFSGDRTEFNLATFEGHAEFDKAAFSGLVELEGATFGGGSRFEGATFSGYTVFSGATFSGASGFDARFEGATFEGPAEFEGAAFEGGAHFAKVTFGGGAWLARATFSGDAWFYEATFESDTRFNNATFAHRAEFGGATFNGHAGFEGATFNAADSGEVTFNGSDDAQFSNATFAHRADFGGATFKRRAGLERATFRGDADFGEVSFYGDAGFDRATFSGGTDFAGATFKRRAGFAGARFEQARQFGPLLAYQGLMLDDVQFAQSVQIEVSSTRVSCRRARFPGGVQFRLRWARVVLDDTDLPAPSILAGIPYLSSEKLARREEQIARDWQQELTGEIPGRPQLVSLRRANVSGLGLSNVSAADCRFAGAHNLDKLRLESDVSFATAPSPAGSRVSRWGGREVIAEERAWRADPWRAKRSRRLWVAPRWPEWLGDQPGGLDPGQIAGLYRALRKGREDVKDEPGAADFYYGEMEMRRARPVSSRNPGAQSSPTAKGRVERAILTAYWLVSGYGLRAWRAVAGLAVVTALLAVAFHLTIINGWGYGAGCRLGPEVCRCHEVCRRWRAGRG